MTPRIPYILGDLLVYDISTAEVKPTRLKNRYKYLYQPECKVRKSSKAYVPLALGVYLAYMGLG